jgi:hypothetical protein
MCNSLDSLCIAKLSVYAEAVEHGLNGLSRGFRVAPWTTAEKGVCLLKTSSDEKATVREADFRPQSFTKRLGVTGRGKGRMA